MNIFQSCRFVMVCFGLTAMIQAKSTYVAFYATLTKNQFLRGTKTVVYDNVYTNLGSSYNNIDGTFTAPEKGLYYLTATLMSLHTKDLHIFMMKNKNVIGYGHGARGGAEMGSVNAVIELGKGDVVKMVHDARQGDQTIYGEGFCSFAGYLITNLSSDRNSAEYVEIHLKSKLK
ncbi:complement C1q tumor necrosis factor-related protein 3-like [Mytilus californianus]|uniref:complement C1q tumor necrosis factor-related protein 3-like n=1 Tax=Mytilus californianus TaxID=6549 RepID=UPI002245227E|nr:complement C1q tumor necrosis factor-related protein 3-like [Mytilus californianus]